GEGRLRAGRGTVLAPDAPRVSQCVQLTKDEVVGDLAGGGLVAVWGVGDLHVTGPVRHRTHGPHQVPLRPLQVVDVTLEPQSGDVVQQPADQVHRVEEEPGRLDRVQQLRV